MRILLADDHEVVRRGLKQLLTDEFGEVAFGEAATASQALEQARQKEWDLILLDLNMPDHSGLEVLDQLASERRQVRVLVLSVSPEEDYAARAIRKGAAGYLTKDVLAKELTTAVRKILSGGHYLTPTLTARLAEMFAQKDNTVHPHERLSDREMQVMRMICLGKSVKEIAANLNLSEKTVFTYRDRLRVKLGVRSDVDLTRYAIQHRLVV